MLSACSRVNFPLSTASSSFSATLSIVSSLVNFKEESLVSTLVSLIFSIPVSDFETTDLLPLSISIFPELLSIELIDTSSFGSFFNAEKSI